MSYTPNYLMYSKAPQGFHDEPFEYCFSFSKDFGANIASASVASFQSPLQLDPDADFYARSMSIMLFIRNLAGSSGGGLETRIDFSMRLRDCFGRPLDSDFMVMSAYAMPPNQNGVFNININFPTMVGTPILPELYCPANGFMFGDFLGVNANRTYNFSLYFQGVKRFQDEECKP